jgi:hypothetical protein
MTAESSTTAANPSSEKPAQPSAAQVAAAPWAHRPAPESDTAKTANRVGIILQSMSMQADDGTKDEKPSRLTRFHSASPPSVGMRQYLARLSHFFGCSAECYVLGLIYIDRLLKRHPGITFNKLTGHRLLITAMLLAAKNHDDVFRTNAYYAKVGGVTLKELNALERCFLLGLDWKLHVPFEEYERYRGHIDTLSQC